MSSRRPPMTNEPSRRLARLTVDLSAICANWRRFADMAGAGEAAAVVKADAYGLGVRHVAPALALEGARTFFVATLAEALEAPLHPVHDPVVAEEGTGRADRRPGGRARRGDRCVRRR